MCVVSVKGVGWVEGVMDVSYVALLRCLVLVLSLSSCVSVHPLLLHEWFPVRARVGGRDGAHVLLGARSALSQFLVSVSRLSLSLSLSLVTLTLENLWL